MAIVFAILNFGYLIYIGRVLGPSEYSEFSAALSFFFFAALALSPLTPAIARVSARRVARGEGAAVAGLRRGVMKPLAAGAVIAAVVLALPVFGLSRFLRYETATPLVLALLSALAFAVLSADRGFLQGLFRFHAYNGSILIEAVTRIVVGVSVFAAGGRNAAGALMGYLAAIVTAEIFNDLVFRRSNPAGGETDVDWSELRSLVFPMMALMMAAALYQNVDMMLVKRWFPAVLAGQYGAAATLAKMFGAVFTPLYVLIGPELTRHHERGEPLLRPALRITGLFAALSSVGLLLLYLRSEEIVHLLFGSAYVSAAWVAAHLGAVSVLLHSSMLLTQVFITVHDFRFLRWFALAAVVQGLGLALFHATIGEVLATLYVAQVIIIIPLSVGLAKHARAND